MNLNIIQHLECQLKKRKVASKGLVVKPLLSKDLNCRGQVDLVDMQSLPDRDYKFIMHYQDHVTKFSVLKALTSKHAAEVGYQLLDIFLLFGAPHILQSDNNFPRKAVIFSHANYQHVFNVSIISFYTPLRL
jgi:hypothetical protein